MTAFVGRAWRGPVDEPAPIVSFGDYQRRFGDLWRESTLSYAVKQFFENGGTQAIVVRVASRSGASAARAATITLASGEVFRAANPGSWGLNLRITVEHDPPGQPRDPKLFTLTVLDDAASRRDALGRGGSGMTERFINVSADPASPQFVTRVLAEQSALIRVESGLRAQAPAAQADAAADEASGSDGAAIGTAEVTDPVNRPGRTGLYALEKTDLFNLLCIPPYRRDADLDIADDWMSAARYCAERRAFLIIDAPAGWSAGDAVGQVSAFGAIVRRNAAIYFPRVLAADPLDADQIVPFAPCGMVAGVISRTDAARGVWKAPAGVDARIAGAAGLSINLTDVASGPLNAAGINCLRVFPTIGCVVWGARTLDGSDAMASDWKYVPVRRLALFIEESIYRGTQWAVFEPNAEPLWAALRLNVGSFLNTLFRQGAFTGAAPNDSYFVACDQTTTTQNDIDNGKVNIVVGFAPAHPAEFVIISISLMLAPPD